MRTVILTIGVLLANATNANAMLPYGKIGTSFFIGLLIGAVVVMDVTEWMERIRKK